MYWLNLHWLHNWCLQRCEGSHTTLDHSPAHIDDNTVNKIPPMVYLMRSMFWCTLVCVSNSDKVVSSDVDSLRQFIELIELFYNNSIHSIWNQQQPFRNHLIRSSAVTLVAISPLINWDSNQSKTTVAFVLTNSIKLQKKSKQWTFKKSVLQSDTPESVLWFPFLCFPRSLVFLVTGAMNA